MCMSVISHESVNCYRKHLSAFVNEGLKAVPVGQFNKTEMEGRGEGTQIIVLSIQLIKKKNSCFIS